MRYILLGSLVLFTTFFVMSQDKKVKKPLKPGHCLGIKKKTGDSCGVVPKEGKYCIWHDPKSTHCSKEGCGMIVARKGDYCIYHMK